MKLAIATYDTPHKKTLDVLMGLMNRGLTDITLLTLPFKHRPAREVLVQHRPEQFEGPEPSQIADEFGLAIMPYDSATDDLGLDHILIGGAGLIDVSRFKRTKVVNAHPGLTPLVRGLDSLKWAVLEKMPIGNTIHFVDEGVDSGEIIAQRRLPVWETDTFDLIAERLYKDEIDFMVHFDQFLDNRLVLDLEEGPRHMRMPIDTEREMMASFPEAVKILAKQAG